jgi:hypothetical protein
MSGITITEYRRTEYRRLVRGSLRGFVTVEMPSGVIYHSVGLMQSHSIAWATPPSKPAIARDGSPIMKGGKALYSPIVSFNSKELRDRFSTAIVAAVLEQFPNAFDDDVGGVP